MKLVGETHDGKMVFEGVYQFYQERGLPLSAILSFMWDNSALPDWKAEVRAMKQHGVKNPRARLIEAVADCSYPNDFRANIMDRLAGE